MPSKSAGNALASAGNVYRHDYEDVEQYLVWGTVPALLAMVEQELVHLDIAPRSQARRKPE